MQLIQFLAAWLFPGGGAQCFAAAEMATAHSSELDRASSSPSSSVNAAGAGSGSSLSSPSTSSSSDDGGHDSGSFKSRSRQESPSTTPLCFGAGGAGAGAGRRLLLRGSRARAPAKQQLQQQEEEAAATMAPKVKADVVGRYLRKISRRLRKARSGGKVSPSPMAAVDDTARERAESVARAISYCKDTLRRGTSRSPSPSPPPPPSPSLDDWLHDRQEEIIATAAELHCDDDECRDPRPSPTRPRRAAAGWPLGMQTMSKRFKESPCPASPSRDGSIAAVAHGEEDESPHHGHGRRGESMSSLDEMEFLKAFDGDEEMISHHFITVEI